MTALLLRTTLLAGAVLLPFGALAADVTPEQGRAAEAAVRDWIGTLTGSAVKVPERPVQLTPAGDHFDAAIPIYGKGPNAKPVTTVTAEVRPLDGGKWDVSRIRAQMPVTFTVQMPVPPSDDDKKPDGNKAPPKTVPVTYTIDLQNQDGHGVIDPAFTGPVTWTTSNTGATVKTEGGPLPTVTTAGPSDSKTVLTPTGPDRIDLTSATTVQDYKVSSPEGAGTPFAATMKQLSVGLSINGLSRSHAQTLSQAIFKVLASLPATSGSASPDIGPEVAATMIGALQDAASAMALNEEADTLAITAGGVPVTMDKIVFGLVGKSVDGVLQAGGTVSVRGLAIGGVLPPDLAALVPTEVTLRPVLSGVGVAEGARLLQAANTKRDPDPADINALFSHGGVTVGVDSMTVAVGGATFGGNGSLVFTSPQAFTGTAHITATGIDALMEKVSKIPQYGPQAMAGFALVKGMGKTVGDQIVWDVAYKDGAATVNGMALPGMGGPGATAPDSAPAPTTPARPQRPARPGRPQAK